jgi:hypothetical protein
MRITELKATEKTVRVMAIILLSVSIAFAENGSKTPQAQAAPAEAPTTQDDYSGMYTFLREGEFVQITVEDPGHVTGFVSRYGDSASDQGAFLDHFFKQAKLDGRDLTFTTETVHGTWFEFKGKLDRGSAKTRAQEGYYVLKGTLTANITDAAKKVSAKAREVEFKLFPEDAGAKDAGSAAEKRN